ncbi:hypothetical protein S40293_06330 [Stachybotrys chartarum IBT 40293]|nr:hypothetical protein S40293_06330 [Stachybotrys chartarum IBT 40293]KFA75366.1 hypothetical protein S40288_01993 [Stachybotrys chartarum IBT 40288]
MASAKFLSRIASPARKEGSSSGLGQLASLLRFYHHWKLLITVVMPPASTRPLLASRSLWNPSLLRQDAARTWPLQTVRYVSRESMRNSMRRESQQAMKQGGAGVSIGEMRKESITEFYKNSGGPFFPCTFVSLPLSQVSTGQIPAYYFQRWKAWAADVLAVLSFKLRSMEGWTTRPRFKVRRGKIVPTGQALHREVMQAFAAGDKPTIQRLCVAAYANKLISTIEKRTPRERTRFEFVKYTRPLFYPKLMTYRLTDIADLGEQSLLEQAVVGISSTQKAWKEDAASGQVIAGTLKVQDKIEYVVLTRYTNAETFESGEWRVWGTTSGTTLEGYHAEVKSLEQEQASQAGWDKKDAQTKGRA